jgi:hypothetical protein
MHSAAALPTTTPSKRPHRCHLGVSLLCVVGVQIAACLPTFPAAPPAATPVKDDFSDPDLKGRYHLQGGTWRVVDGALTSLGERNLPLWHKAPLSKNVRVEFTAMSASPAVDIKVELFGDGVRHESGYIVIFGGWSNTLGVIARLDEHEKKRTERRLRLVPNQRYRVRIERQDGKTLRVFLDDNEILTRIDNDPLWGPRNNRFAFSNWESHVSFDDLVITPLPD